MTNNQGITPDYLQNIGNKTHKQAREKILNILHKTEGCENCATHFKPPHKCDMDLAAPRCVQRVKRLEKLLDQYTEQKILEVVRDKLQEIHHFDKGDTVSVQTVADRVADELAKVESQLAKIKEGRNGKNSSS